MCQLDARMNLVFVEETIEQRRGAGYAAPGGTGSGVGQGAKYLSASRSRGPHKVINSILRMELMKRSKSMSKRKNVLNDCKKSLQEIF